ncbi:putative secretory protein [Escherichia coli]|nr:putative secretory protein [Escherichia coli]
MTLERISAFITYCIAVVLAWLGDLSIKDASTLAPDDWCTDAGYQLVLQTQSLPASARRADLAGGL